MSEQIDEKIKNYRTAPFDARFPNTNQTRNCFQNYLGKGDYLISLGFYTWVFTKAVKKNVMTQDVFLGLL